MLSWLSSHPLLSVALALVATYVGISLGYLVFHRFFIFFPSRAMSRLPTDLGMVYEELFLQTADHVRLQLWLIPRSLTSGQKPACGMTLVFFPGNEGTLSKFLPSLKVLHEAGFDLVLFSYRGFGKSTHRRPTEKGLRQDCRAVWEFLIQRRRLDPKHILFYGQSIGSALAAWSALTFQPAALIVEGAFPSVAYVAHRVVPWLPTGWMTTERFNTAACLRNLSIPVVIAHSTEDEVIPFDVARQLVDLPRGNKTLVSLTGAHAKGLDQSPHLLLGGLMSLLTELDAIKNPRSQDSPENRG